MLTRPKGFCEVRAVRIDIVTIFPGMFAALDESIIRRAQDTGLVQIVVTDLRTFAKNKHRSVDDYSYGGGPGMVMQPEPFYLAVEELQKADPRRGPVILLSPRGSQFTQAKARELAQCERLTFLCGHYEGIDERVRAGLVDEEISLGDFVLTGGEIPAMAIADAVVRLLPGVLPEASTAQESFSESLLEYPQYTRPANFRGMIVPDVLLSGNHAQIDRWRREQSLLKTLQTRPELLAAANLSQDDKRLLVEEAKRLGIANLL
jgi:tRNA (guanine37-N1)-methyltransferase